MTRTRAAENCRQMVLSTFLTQRLSLHYTADIFDPFHRDLTTFRRNDHDPRIKDRFELFIAGREIANGFY